MNRDLVATENESECVNIVSFYHSMSIRPTEWTNNHRYL